MYFFIILILDIILQCDRFEKKYTRIKIYFLINSVIIDIIYSTPKINKKNITIK